MNVRVGLVLLCALAVVVQVPLRADAVPSLTVTPSLAIRRAVRDTVMVTHDVPNPDTEATRK